MHYENQETNTLKVPLWLVAGTLIFAILGFSDATYIAINHLKGIIPPCSVLNGCESVLTSKYSHIGPLRLEWLGMAYYLTIITLVIGYFDSKRERLLWYAAQLTFVGIVASAILIGIQTFVIGEYCLYCMISAGTSVILFIFGRMISKKLTTR